jgi:hypothetical protein
MACRVHATDLFSWSHVVVGGGGYVTGLLIHPANSTVVYARTDVGGAYRWDTASSSWIPLTDWIADGNNNLSGIDGFAVDPSNTNIVYLACGKSLGSSPHGIYKSLTQGTTWSGPYLSGVAMAGNDNITGGRASPFLRNAGERLAVDPNLGSILYFGSRADGLWKSTDAGLNWTHVAVPGLVTNAGYGVSFVAFDPTSGRPGVASTNLYIGACGTTSSGSDGGVYRSSNGGSTWVELANPASGAVNQPRRGQCSRVDGTLWVTHQDGVAKAGRTATALTDVTPAGYAGSTFNALALDSANAANAVAMGGSAAASNPMFRTTNAGASWSQIGAGTHASAVPWWTSGMWAAWISACAINPAQPKQLWYSDWYGIWKTDDYTVASPTWHNYENGHEEICLFNLACPPAGSAAELLSVCYDVDGFRHGNVNAFPSNRIDSGGVKYQDGHGLDYCEANPNFLVRVGVTSSGSGGVCKSADDGATWSSCAGWPTASLPNRVAVSASNTNIFLVTVDSAKPMYTSNGGASFTTCAGTVNEAGGLKDGAIALAADRVDGNRFYYYASGQLYLSVDGGRTFASVSSALASDNSNPVLRAVPGAPGELWVSLDGNGLWRSVNSGTNFTEVRNAQGRLTVWEFGFGKPGSGSVPWVYVHGLISGTEGVFLSKDRGTTWTPVNPPGGLVCADAKVLDASRQTVGRVFLGTGGRGVFMGSLLPPAMPANLVAAGGVGAVSLSWSAVANADSYIIKRSTTSGKEIPLTNTTTSRYVDSGLTAGTIYYYKVSATNLVGASADSAEVSATVDVPPSCRILKPLAGTIYPAPAAMTVLANAADSDGTVTNVDFRLNGVKVGQAVYSPFSFTTNGVPAGDYNLTAIAVDSAGAATTSSVVNITVSSLPVALSVAQSNGALVLSWPGFWVLQSKARLEDSIPWVDVTNALSPYNLPLLPQGAQYFRLQSP